MARSVRAQGVSPGKLAKDHAALEGTNNCIRCHSSGDAVSASLCLSCHKALGQRIASKAGYHATTGDDCARCHPDHRGVNAALVKWPGGSADKLDHAKTGYKLEGEHAKTACRDCHKVELLKGSVAPLLTEHWVQLAGNHEAQYLPGATVFWPEPLPQRGVETLREWWADGRMQVAAAITTNGEEFLLTHAGLTLAAWRQLGEPASAARAALRRSRAPAPIP